MPVCVWDCCLTCQFLRYNLKPSLRRGANYLEDADFIKYKEAVILRLPPQCRSYCLLSSLSSDSYCLYFTSNMQSVAFQLEVGEATEAQRYLWDYFSPYSSEIGKRTSCWLIYIKTRVGVRVMQLSKSLQNKARWFSKSFTPLDQEAGTSKV